MTDIIDRPSWLRRLAWFAGLWVAGVLTITLIGMILRAWLLGA